MVPNNSRVSKEIASLIQKEASKADHKMLPVYEEKGVYNFYIKMGSKGSVEPMEPALAQMSKDELVEMVRQLQRDPSRQP